MYGGDLSWRLLYTKPRAEARADANLRRQGFATLMPWVKGRSDIAPLSPHCLFAGVQHGQSDRVLHGTYGVLYAAHCGDCPARVPGEVIGEIRARMDGYEVVHLEQEPERDMLFVSRERERTEALLRLAQVGFRVRIAWVCAFSIRLSPPSVCACHC